MKQALLKCFGMGGGVSSPSTLEERVLHRDSLATTSFSSWLDGTAASSSSLRSSAGDHIYDGGSDDSFVFSHQHVPLEDQPTPFLRRTKRTSDDDGEEQVVDPVVDGRSTGFSWHVEGEDVVDEGAGTGFSTDCPGLGFFSVATVRSHTPNQDVYHIYVNNGSAAFFGVYDGRHAAAFVANRIFDRFLEVAAERGGVDEYVLRDAVVDVDGELVDHATELPLPCRLGACCAVGLLWGKTLYVADVGDSGIVSSRGAVLTAEHAGRVVPLRQDHALVWRAHMPVARCIGDGYVKADEGRSRVHAAKYDLGEDDEYLICATHGLWQHLSAERAREIVADSPLPTGGIARRLAWEAVKKATSARGGNVDVKRRLMGDQRLEYQDDMTVIVVYPTSKWQRRGRDASAPECPADVVGWWRRGNWFKPHAAGRSRSH